MSATSDAASAGIAATVVNGPYTPVRITHASAPRPRTVRAASARKLSLSPARMSVIAKTTDVPTTAMTNRRSRHCRSRSVASHMQTSGCAGATTITCARAPHRQPADTLGVGWPTVTPTYCHALRPARRSDRGRVGK